MGELKRRRDQRLRAEMQAYGFLAPTILLLAIFLLSPLVTGLVLSFYQTALSGSSHFVGLKNYMFFLGEIRFLNNLWLSVVYVLGNLGVSLPLAYLLALTICKNIRTASALRSLFLLPWVVAPVVSTVLFRSLADPVFGPLSQLVEKISGQPHVILAEPVGAMALIVLHSIWRSLPFMILFLSAGIAMIPNEVYEAARVDGAGKWTQFFKLTLPLTKNHLIIVLLTITLWTLQDAETIYAMTEGGPGYSTEVIAIRLFKESFINFDLNAGATLGILLLLVGLLFMLIYTGRMGKMGEGD